METNICVLCKQNPSVTRIEGMDFCSKLCFMLWIELEQARLTAKAFNMILDEHFAEDKDANTRPSE